MSRVQRRRPPTSRPPRSILPADRKRIVAELHLRCRPGERSRSSFAALRLRAAVLLAAGSGLRVSEVCKLNLAQMLEDPEAARWRLRSLVYLKPSQAKGRRVGEHKWTSAGTIAVSDEARNALRAYIAELKRRGWSVWPPPAAQPLFVAVRTSPRTRRAAAPVHQRLSIRTLQHQWRTFQRAIGIESTYHFHDLRHTALTRCSELTGGNMKLVAEFGRCDLQTAARYVHLTPGRLTALRNDLAFR